MSHRPAPDQEFLLKKIATAILIAAAASVASADGLKSLESFMKGTQTGKVLSGSGINQPLGFANLSGGRQFAINKRQLS